MYPLYLRTYGTDGNQIAEREENTIRLQAYFSGSSWRERWSYAMTENPVNTDGYTAIHFSLDPYWYQGDSRRYTLIGHNSEIGHGLTGQIINNAAVGVYSVDSPGGAKHIGVSAYVNTKSSLNQHRAAVRVAAIWME